MFWLPARIPEPGSAAGRRRDRNAQGGIKRRETRAANPGCEGAEWSWSDRMDERAASPPSPSRCSPELVEKGDAQSSRVEESREATQREHGGGDRGSYSSSQITPMHDSMSIGNVRHKIPCFLFSLICSEKASLLVLLSGCKEGIISCKCLTSTIWQSNWILQLSYKKIEICIFHFTNQKSFCFT